MVHNKMPSAGTTLAAGTLLGIGIGMLLAPKRGSEVRSDISELSHKAGDKLQRTKGLLRDKVRSARDKTEDVVEEAIEEREPILGGL